MKNKMEFKAGERDAIFVVGFNAVEKNVFFSVISFILNEFTWYLTENSKKKALHSKKLLLSIQKYS